MQKTSVRLAALGCISLLAACTSGQSGILPSYTSVSPVSISKLQFAVGTANYNGKPALNTVATLRQANGLSATLLNTPSIVGPSGFTVTADANNPTNIDVNTSSITATAQTLPGTSFPVTTFNQSGGVFAYGFAPLNSTQNGSNVTGITATGFYREPFYSTPQIRPLIGPPAVPNFQDGLTPGGFSGYPSGFTSFSNVTLVPGAYALNVVFPSADPRFGGTLTASASLVSTALLPNFPAPAFASDGAGGGSVSISVPAGVTETIVYIRDFNPNIGNTYYSYVVQGIGPQTVTVSPTLGAKSATGVQSPSFTVGDSVYTTAVGFDYPAFEAAPPGNTQQTPVIVGANGQADLTSSPITTFSY